MLRGLYPLRIALLLALLELLTFPTLPLQVWVIPLVISFYSQPYLRSIWIALGTGLFLDLLGNHEPFGLYALLTTVTTLLLHRFKMRFFEESLTTLPLLSALYSAIFSLLLILITPPAHASMLTLRISLSAWSKPTRHGWRSCLP